jgi:hypothetical protein
MRPRLPKEIELIFPSELVHLIYTFVPHEPKEKKKEYSPTLQKDLWKIQTSAIGRNNAMFMKGLDDFCLV